MDEEVRIRPLTPYDGEAAYALRLRALREDPQAFGQSPQELLAEPIADFATRLENNAARVVLGAFYGYNLVGVGGLHRQNHAKMLHQAHVRGMYVAREARGRGLGRRLLHELLQRARSMEDLRVVLLWVVTTNVPAWKIYADAGFEIWTTERMALRIGDDFLDQYVMGLVL